MIPKRIERSGGIVAFSGFLDLRSTLFDLPTRVMPLRSSSAVREFILLHESQQSESSYVTAR
jgi:hypothetical protein